MKPTLLVVKEIALVMGVSTQSIRRAYWRGDIPAFRVWKIVRFDLERVRRIFLAKGLPGGVMRGRHGARPAAPAGGAHAHAPDW
jgi:hypothetical protein